jgi:diphthine-ammonia ligase
VINFIKNHRNYDIMCGIVGIFNDLEAVKKVRQALALMANRGKDGCKLIEVGVNSAMGHRLHAMVDKVVQPLHGEGILTANCEIYNWQELNKKYDFNARNDAEFLLRLFDKFGMTKIAELDGVYACAYYKDGKVFLLRDILGVKPLWYSTEGSLSFASEGKVLTDNARELNPRQVLVYDVENSLVDFDQREFYTYSPEHNEDPRQMTEELLSKAIVKRIPNKKFGLLFSGGIDSTYLAKYLKDNNYDFTCYTAVLDTDNVVSADLVSAQEVAANLGLRLKIKKVSMAEIPKHLEKIVPLIEDSNVVKVGVALTFYAACEMAKEDGCKVVFSGLGSEEIFAGYERHKHSANINQECRSGLLKMYERDLYRDDVITMEHSLELRLPFLDKDLVEYAVKIPAKYKINSENSKIILREIALSLGIPREFAWRKKVAAQYGSRFDYALGKLAKQARISKSAYLFKFYQRPNLKLGVLFSSGKDSMSAAYIMQKQNYDLSCLITIKSCNEDSYMFQTAGTELVELQAKAMDLPLIVKTSLGMKEVELDDLEIAIKEAIETYKIEGIITGAIFSTYQRDRIERICEKLGLKMFSPLWHKSQEKHMLEVVGNGFEVILTAVAAEGLDESWLGRKVDLELIETMKKLSGINQAGEGGEFESLVLNGPLFKKRIEVMVADKLMDTTYSGKLIIKEARLVEK